MRKSKSGTIISAPDLDFWTHLNVLLSFSVTEKIQFRSILPLVPSSRVCLEKLNHNLSNWQTQILRYDNRRPLLLKTSFWIVTSKAEYKTEKIKVFEMLVIWRTSTQNEQNRTRNDLSKQENVRPKPNISKSAPQNFFQKFQYKPRGFNWSFLGSDTYAY